MRKINFWLFSTFIFSFSFLLLSYLPNFYEASVINLLPKDRMMIWGEHIYTYDYNVYLSKIRQGKEGRWTVVDKYDNHPDQKGVLLQMLYLLSGKIGGIFNLAPGLIFHLLRTFASFFWVLTIIYLNIYFLKKPPLYALGIIFCLLASSFPVFQNTNGHFWVGMHLAWWQEMDVLKRISYLPHYTLNYIIIGLLSLFLSELYQNQSYQSKSKISSKYLIIGVFLFFSFFIHPSSGILFLISWLFYHSIRLLWYPLNFKIIPQIIFQTIILITIAFIPLMYFKHITSFYPWKSLVDFDQLHQFPLDLKEYIFALGPVFFTGILGAIIVLFKKEQKLLTLVTWILGAFLAIIIFKKFPYQSELRFIQTANHIPLAILSVYLLNWLISRRRHLTTTVLAVVAVLITLTFGVLQSYFSLRGQTDFIHQRAVAILPLVPYPPQVMYPLKDFWTAILWLEKNTSKDEVVLSQVTAGNYIPAYSGNFVYLGHNPETPFFNQRTSDVNQFYSGTMDDQQAYRFLKENHIAYVFFGPQEKEKNLQDIKRYPFLQPVLSLPLVTLFRVKI